MKKAFALIIAFVLAFSISAPKTVFAGTSFSTATTISLNTDTSCTISTAGTKQYYKFTASATGKYAFYSKGNYKTYAYIYDSSYNKLYQGYAHGMGENFKLFATFTAGKTYYLSASMFYSNQTGTFTVRIEKECYSLNSAGFLDANTKSTCSISFSGASMYYEFTPTITGTYFFRSYGRYNTYATIYDENGRALSYNDDYYNDINFNVVYELQANVRYFFSAKMSGYYSTGSFDIKLEYYSGSSVYDASTISAGMRKDCSIPYPELEMVYSFTASESSLYVFYLLGENNSDRSIRILDSEGNSAYESERYSGESITCDYYLKAGETCFVGVSYNGGYSYDVSHIGSLTLGVEKCTLGVDFLSGETMTISTSEKGVYEIFSISDGDPAAKIYYNNDLLATGSNTGDSKDFKIKRYLKGDTSYTFIVTGSFSDCYVFLKKSKCTHSYASKNKTKKATKSTDGYYYQPCKTCGYEKKTTVPKIKKVALSAKSFTYTGKAIKPKAVIMDSAGKDISKNCTIKYSNNKKIGTATATIKMNGDYSGTYNVSFKINPKPTSIKTSISSNKKKNLIYPKWEKISGVTGYEFCIAEDKNFKKNCKTVNINKQSVTSVTVKVKKNTTYYMKVRTYKKVGKTKYYSEWSKKVSCKLKK